MNTHSAPARLIALFSLSVFVALHVGALSSLWVGVSWQGLTICAALYVVRMWGVTAGYHRYFSHRTFKTSRAFQLVLAVVAQSSAQKGALWWAAHHRHHHKHSDRSEDIHSPRDGFWRSHMGWFIDPQNDGTHWDNIRDLTRFPELVWLNRFHWVPGAVLGFGLYFATDYATWATGFALSTVLVWHATFTINSLSHVWGTRRYHTTDTSRNNPWLALLTLGEGWHNNHHHYQSSTRQGFYPWEIDITYGVLKLMQWCGIVWDIREPPARVYKKGETTPTSPLAPSEAV